MALYGKVDYWEERYAHSGETASYDWYQNYATLRHLMNTETLAATSSAGASTSRIQDASESELTRSTLSTRFFPCYDVCRVLILGCGNSSFGEHMREDGWNGEIVNVDFSTIVIDQMKKREEINFARRNNEKSTESSKLRFVCVDVTGPLPFKDGSFDLIICKGTFDAILCSNVACINAKRLVAECSRVLAPGYGCLFLCSYGTPDNRVVFLEHDNDLSHFWREVSIHTVPRKKPGRKGGSKFDYVYICRKQPSSLTDDARRETDVTFSGGMASAKDFGENAAPVAGDVAKATS